MGRIRVLVADGHRIFAEALATALAAEPDIDVAAAGSTQAAERALDRAVAENRPFQVLLVDADLSAGPPLPPGDTRSAPARPATAFPPATAAAPATGRTDGADRPRPEQHRPDQHRPDQHRPDQNRPEQHRPDQHRPDQHRPAAQQRAVVPLPTQRRPATVARLTQPPQAATAAPPAAVRIPPPRADGGPPPPGRAGDADAADGIALVARARTAHPDLRVVVLATDDDPRRTVRALHAGASGWVAKESSLGRLTAIVRGVLRDETHIPPLLLTGVVRELTAARRDRTESERLVESLTPREQQVLRCMVAGLGRQAVADRLYLSPHTVRTHMQNVLGKLGVHSTLAAVALARRAGVGPAE